jgi:hypothetical protein
MRPALTLPLAAALLAAPAAAADLAKIDRAIKKEPAYKDKPAYLLLTFGERAQDRAWLVHDGDVLYVDRNGDGDLTGNDEKVAKMVDKSRRKEGGWTFEVGELRVGGKVHKALTVRIAPLKSLADHPALGDFKPLRDALKADPDSRTVALTIDVESARLKGGGLGGRLSFVAGPIDGTGVLRFASTPKAAPVLHLGGPLQVTLCGPKPSLTLGRADDLVLAVGAPGRGPGTLAMLAYDGAVPKGAHPKVEVSWPGAKKGDRPVKELYELKDRC